MKQLLSVVYAIIIGLSIIIGTYAQEKEKVEKKDTVIQVKSEVNTSSNQMIEDEKPLNNICPVSDEEADQAVTYAYNGKTYAFCCNKCLNKFKADPEKYINKMKENENPPDHLKPGDKK